MRKHCVFLYFAIFQIRLRHYDIRVRQKEPTGTAELLYPHCGGAWRRRTIRVAQSPRFTAADRDDRSANKKARARQAQSRPSDGSVVFPFFAEFRFQQSDQIYVFDGKIRGQDGHGEEHGAHYDAQRVNKILHSARAEE